MHDRMLHAAAGFALRHERVLGIAGAIWFALGCASYARFIDLPRIPFVTDRYAFWLSGAWNAVWWGFLHPRIEQRKVAIGGGAGQVAHEGPEPAGSGRQSGER